jgi:flagellar hook assembly protein FlgD
LVDEIQPAGYQQVHWDGHDQYGHEIGSGIYLIRLEAGQQRFVRRITLLK